MCCGLTSLTSISCDGAFSPRQWILEGLEEIEDAPADNHIIIEANKTTNLRGKKETATAMLITSTNNHCLTTQNTNTKSTGDKQFAIC